MSALAIEPLGERAVRFALPEGVDRRALLLALRATPGVIDVVITETHAGVVFEREPVALEEAVASARASAAAGRTHVIRVAYDGPDLREVASVCGLDPSALVARHAGAMYVVAFVGFVPGFAYLRGLDEVLAKVARRASPRARVPAGSVALAGGYTGVYPFATPGGWQLVGRALDHAPLDATGEARLAIGDRVRFEPV